MVAGLITAASTAPISAYVAYTHHIEAMERLAIDRSRSASEEDASSKRRLEERRSVCAQVMTLLGDEKTNPALLASERQILLTDLRRTASSCMRSVIEGEAGGGS